MILFITRRSKSQYQQASSINEDKSCSSQYEIKQKMSESKSSVRDSQPRNQRERLNRYEKEQQYRQYMANTVINNVSSEHQAPTAQIQPVQAPGEVMHQQIYYDKDQEPIPPPGLPLTGPQPNQLPERIEPVMIDNHGEAPQAAAVDRDRVDGTRLAVVSAVGAIVGGAIQYSITSMAVTEAAIVAEALVASEVVGVAAAATASFLSGAVIGLAIFGIIYYLISSR